MSILDYRNLNTLWASVIVETLHRLGLTTAIICPGSRSTPLTVAFARHASIEAIPILDERSAAFFALGCAKRTHQPVAIVCTSGTAGANFLPAIIEAKESHVPLMIFTADRPPEMRACASGQTIDQQKLYGAFVNTYGEMAVPEVALLGYARQTMVHSWTQALSPNPGPIHLNCPFRDPLAPVSVPLTQQIDESSFFAGIQPPWLPQRTQATIPETIWQRWCQTQRGLIVAGSAQPADPVAYCYAVVTLSKALGWPVLADSLSPLRNYAPLNPYLVSNYDTLLRRDPELLTSELNPEAVIQLGPLPTSKVLRQWLQQTQPQTYQVSPYSQNIDPLHGKTQCLGVAIEDLADCLVAKVNHSSDQAIVSPYCSTWLGYEYTIRKTIDQVLQPMQKPFEGKISWLLSQYLPENTPLVVANSMPIRDLESFWQPNDRHICPYFSRGANGIDGTLSTAMGIAHHSQNSLLLTGDLAFLHDTNGLLNARYLSGSLTVILINNQGGGIFEMLPISNFDPLFEKYFVTPQTVNIPDLCHAYGVQHTLIDTWDQLTQMIKDLALPKETALRVLEFRSDRKADAHWRKTQIKQLAG
ncbi:MAG: 2-succinyl-5-enolpyruvyl-6-hydroxy-3-cyclohexene-1-carboxylic-acid synthase [Cyanobacteria bacterium J06642_11]